MSPLWFLTESSEYPSRQLEIFLRMKRWTWTISGKCLEKLIPGSKSLYNPWISLPWLWLSVKWPMKQKCCGSTAGKAFQTQGVGFSEAYLFACLFSDFKYPWIYIFGDQSRKLLRGIFFFPWTVYNVFQMKDNFSRRIYHNWEY